MSAAPLPPVLDEKLTHLAAQVRRWLILRGCGWVALTALCGAAVAIGLDAAFGLSVGVRALLLVGWLVGCGLLLWRRVVQPWRNEVPTAELAELIEQDFPGLSERLTTLVELNEHSDSGNGSHALIGVLARETDLRTRRLDFARLVPTGSSKRIVVLAAIFMAAALLLLAVLPGCGVHVRRFVLPWYTPAADIAFRIVISSGNPVVKRGEPVTLSAYLEPTRVGAVLPASATLLVRESESQTGKALPMTGSEGAGFHLTLPGVASDFEYRVEAGSARSDWHQVIAADPVTLGSGTTLTIHPPRYAEKTVPSQVREGFAEFEVLQYGRAVLDLRFSQPPTEVYLDWRPVDPANLIRIPIRLHDDRRSGSAEVNLPTDGTLLLVLIGDRGVRTEFPTAVRTIPDAAPRFEKVVGLTGAVRDVRPDERVPIELAARDDLRLEALRIEYCLNENESDMRSEPVLLPGVGSNRAEGAFTFGLTGKVQEGDTIMFRVRASDNRTVAKYMLGPRHAVFPASGWAMLRVTASARPLIEQEVFSQRDRIRDSLTRTAKLVQDITKDVSVVRDAVPADGVLTADQAVRLRRSRETSAEVENRLEELATEVALTPDLRSVANAARELANGSLRSAGAAIQTAETNTARTERDQALSTASDRLTDSLVRLTELNTLNEKSAQARLDRHTLRQIAIDQQALSGQVSKSKSSTDKLVEKQRDLQARLNEAVAHSGALKEALDEAASELLQELLTRARQLVEGQSALDRAIRETEQTARQKRTKELTRRQSELAAEAARLAKQTAAAARLAVTSPLDSQPFDRAVEGLNRGDTDRALTEQEKAAQELDRLATGLARATAARQDLREAAQQFARWQDDLRRRYSDAVNQAPDGKVPDELRNRIAREQQELHDAVKLLRRPNADTDLARSEKTARDESRAAADALSHKPADAPAALRRAADAIAKLAEQMPGVETRKEQARNRLDELIKDQEAIARDADEAVRGASRDAVGQKLDAAGTRQEMLAGKVHQLDLPGQEIRQAIITAAADRAAADLRSGMLPDVALSQQEVGQQLDRLKKSLDGVRTPDELANEVTRLQRGINDRLSQIKGQPSSDQFDKLLRLQREVSRRLAGLTATDVMASLNEAKDTVRNAEESLRKQDRSDELRKKSRKAVDTLSRLAERLARTESDLERVERLIQERTGAIENGKQFDRPAPNPERNEAEQHQLQRQIEELEQTRIGKAHDTRRKAVDALKQVRQAGDPDQKRGRQHAAVEALRQLADEMTRQGGRATVRLPVGPPKPTTADELRRLTGNGHLPTERDAATAEGLARRQRELRDATSEAAVELARGVSPAADDPLGRLATEQEAISAAVRGLDQRLDPAKSPEAKLQIEKATRAARYAAEQVRAGSVAGGVAAGAEAEAELRKLVTSNGSPEVTRKAHELATRQAAFTTKLKKLDGNPAAEAARQQKRQGELATETSQLGDSFRDAAEDGPESSLERAATAADSASRHMTQAQRDAASGRARQAAEARQQAGKTLSEATVQATASAATPRQQSPLDQIARTVGIAVHRAGDQMRRAELHLGKPSNTGSAAKHMNQAVDALKKSVQMLDSLLGGRPGDQPASSSPHSSSTNTDPPIDALPPDITRYLAKPRDELSSETQSKMLQELTAKYGEDYAQTIKLYFESLAQQK